MKEHPSIATIYFNVETEAFRTTGRLICLGKLQFKSLDRIGGNQLGVQKIAILGVVSVLSWSSNLPEGDGGSLEVVSFLLWSSILPEKDGGFGDMRKRQRVTREINRGREKAKRRGYACQNVKRQGQIGKKSKW